MARTLLQVANEQGVVSPLEEGTTPIYTAILTDEEGQALSGLPFTGVRLTLYATYSGAIINGRQNQNALNANNVTISSTGLLTWKLQEADVVLVGTPKPKVGKHRAVFVAEWNDSGGVARQITHELEIPIVGVPNAPLTL